MKASLLALLALSALPVLAQRNPLPQPQVPLVGGGASASLTGLRYELIDLAPDDGIAPTVRFSGGTWARAWGNASYCGRFNFCDSVMGDFNEPTYAQVDGAFGLVTPAGLFAGSAVAVEGEVYGQGLFDGTARLRGAPGQPLFVLSPHTALRVTGQYTLDAFSIPYASRRPRHPYFVGGGVASAYMTSRFLDGIEEGVRISAAGSSQDGTPSFEHQAGELSGLFRNDLDRTLNVWGRIGVNAQTQVPTIPEPSTWALMLAGAGLLGALGRRRAPSRG